MSTVATLKEGSGWVPVLFCSFSFQFNEFPSVDLLVATHPFDGVAGPTFPGIGALPAGVYLSRVQTQDIQALQNRSQLGIDRIAQVTIHLMDADGYLYSNFAQQYGFRGAALQLALVMWQPGTTNFSSDAPLMFTGVCDMEVPAQGLTLITVSANNSHNTSLISLSLFPIETRCPKIFPRDAAGRFRACNDPQSDEYKCGYSADQAGGVGNIATTGGPNNDGKNIINIYGAQVTDAAGVYVQCELLRSDPTRVNLNTGCMARMGNYATTSVAPDGDINHDKNGNHTGSFAGVQWSPGTYYAIAKNFTSGNHVPTFSYINSAILGQFHNLLYGTQWVNAKLANIIESGNDSKSEAMVCTGDVGPNGVALVTVNGVQLGRAPSGDNNLWWDFNNTGNRFGQSNTDTGYNKRGTYSSLGDPYGSICCLRTTFYSTIFTGFGTPTIRVLCNGPQVYHYSLSGGTWTGTLGPSTNPAWNLVDILIQANYTLGELDLQSFFDAATYCDGAVMYLNQANTYATHARFICQFVLEQPRKAADVIAGVLRGCNGYIVKATDTGLLQMFINQTLADSQPDPITGSNDINPYNSSTASYKGDWAAGNTYIIGDRVTFSNTWYVSLANFSTGHQPDTSPSFWAATTQPQGYVAYFFDESTIATIGTGDNKHLDVEAEANPSAQMPNKVYIKFQDMDNGYVEDSLGEVNADAMIRAASVTSNDHVSIPETLNILGISNFDQAVRDANVYMAERQYGNEANDARGTRIFIIGTTVRCSHLHSGHIISLSLKKYGMVKQLFRVLKVAPTTDFQTAKVTLQWHNDVWYEDIFGQAPQSFYGQNNFNRPSRAPNPWQPGAVSPSHSDMFGPTEYTFNINEVDSVDAAGNPVINLTASGFLPVDNIITNVQPPLVPVQAQTATTGGTMAGGQNWLFQIVGVDASGNPSAPSNFISAFIPAGTNTNTVTISPIHWYPGTSTYIVYGGANELTMTQIAAGSASGTSITITSVPFTRYLAPPDLAAAGIFGQVKQVHHAGIVGETVVGVSTTTISIGGALSPWATDITTHPHFLILIGRQDGIDVPPADFLISGVTNGGSGEIVLSVGTDPTAIIQIGDVVVISASATTATDTTIGDPAAVNAFFPLGAFQGSSLGNKVRIIRGTGRYQVRTISGVSLDGATLTISSPWSTVPDDTSQFIVEDATWLGISQTSAFSASTSTSNTQAITAGAENIKKAVWMFQALIVDKTGTLVSNEFYSPFRVWYCFGQHVPTIDVNADITLDPVTQNVRADATGGSFIITIPPFLEWLGLPIVIQKIDNTGNTVTWQLSGLGDTIPGFGTSGVLTDQGETVRLTALL